MKYLSIFLLFLIAGCGKASYYGYVYDYESKKPIEGVAVIDYLNSKETISDSLGYFKLRHESKISGRLIFKKDGYQTDTLETIRIINGEQAIEQFKGDTTFLFSVHSRFRDSISKLNSQNIQINHITADTGSLAFPVSGASLQSIPFREAQEQIIGLQDFYCGMYPMSYDLPMLGKFQVKIIANGCGDYPFYSLVTTFRGKLADKKMIYMKHWANHDDPQEKSSTDFLLARDNVVDIITKTENAGKAERKTERFKIDSKTGVILPMEL